MKTSRLIELDMAHVLGGLQDGSIQVAAGGKCTGLNVSAAPRIKLDAAKVLGLGATQAGLTEKASGTKQLGMRARGIPRG